jgi:hypothetical protein
MSEITYNDLADHAPEVLLPPDPEFVEDYHSRLSIGRLWAARSSVAFVGICRNAMPWLHWTLMYLERTGRCFGQWSAFLYENDSTDGTKDRLSQWADGEARQVSINDNGRPHLNHTTEAVRTHALAEYRAACQSWVRAKAVAPDYVVVFDADPWGGFSVDGVLNSIGWMADPASPCYGAAAMASYSWAESRQPSGPMAIHYDAFAARLNHWRQRDQNWFHLWHPAVGSPPVPFRSAFGQLAVYRTADYLRGTYTGEDCEHVTFHRSIGRPVYLNPSSRCVSFWVPQDAR